MKIKILLLIVILTASLNSFCTVWTVNNSGLTFAPFTLTITTGDSVNFILASNHDAREVNQVTWNANGTTPLAGGFQTPLGGGMVLASQLAIGTHYYVCSIHASLGMKGTIVVNNCTSPTITSVTNSNITCNGANNGSITINATGTPAPLQYSINNGTSFQLSNVFNGLPPGNYAILVKNNAGCTKSAFTAITQPSVISVSYATTNSPCNGLNNGSISINVSGGVGAYQYSINNGAIFQASNLFTNLPAGIYTAMIKDNNGCTQSVPFIISSPPPLILSVQVIPTSCGLNNGSIIINPSGGTPPYNYLVGSTSQSSNIFDSLTPGTYSVVVTDVNGCTIGNSYLVQNSSSTPIISGVISGDTIDCAGSLKTYSITPVATATSYLWTLPAGWIGSSNINSITATVGSIGGVVSVIAQNGCGSSLPKTLNVIVNNVPSQPGSISTSGGIAKVCPGDTRTYTVANVAGVTWNWVVPTGATINNGQGSRIINVTYNSGFISNGIISVVAVNSCGNSIARSLTIARNIPATPSSISGNLFGLCSQTNVAYSVSLVSGVTYNWTVPLGGTIVSGQNTNAITASYPSTALTGSITVTTNNSCGASAQRKAAVTTLPATPISITGANAVCINQVGVPYSISPIASALTYTWTGPIGSHISDGINTSFTNILTTSATAVTVNYGATAGSLKVKANNSCGSGGTRSLIISFICRLQSNIANNAIMLYPNPTKGYVALKFNAEEYQRCQLIVSDISGRNILHSEMETTSGENTFTFDLKDFSNGIYIVKLQTPDGAFVDRIFKEQNN